METQLEELMQMLRCYEKARSEGAAPENLELEKLLSAMKQHESESKAGDDIKLPGESKDEEDDVPREEITPKPFFVVKTCNEQKLKVFINMCGSDKIPGPANVEAGDLPALEEALASVEAAEESVNLRFPLSCSEPLTSTDHCGKPCLVYDIVYSLSILEAAMTAKKIKVFLIETALTWIGQKYNTQLSSDFKLPNVKYKGDIIRTQCIRGAPKGPLISEIPDMEAELKPSFPLLAKTQKPNVCSLTKSDVPSPVTAMSNHESTKTIQDESDSHGSMKTTQENMKIAEPDSHGSIKTIQENVTIAEVDSHGSMKIKPDEENGAPEKPPIFAAESAECGRLPEVLSTDTESKNVNIEPSAPENEESEEHPDRPVVQTEYVGRPVEYVFIHISFPDEVKEEDVTLVATYTQVSVETKNFDSLEVPLLFPISPERAEAELCSGIGLVTLKLPFLGYRKLYCCS